MFEVFDEYFCLLDSCDKEFEDNKPPCCNCGNLINIADLQQIIENKN